jgi:hypothetical protein
VTVIAMAAGIAGIGSERGGLYLSLSLFISLYLSFSLFISLSLDISLRVWSVTVLCRTQSRQQAPRMRGDRGGGGLTLGLKSWGRGVGVYFCRMIPLPKGGKGKMVGSLC